MSKPGRIAFISQSGALCTSILDWSLAENIGFSHFVSIGNATNVNVGDLIDYFDEDPTTESIVLYVESVVEARRFMSAARAFTRNKPIVVYKAGRFAESAQAAASHTGAMAGVDAVYEAAFQTGGHGPCVPGRGYVRLRRALGPPPQAGRAAIGNCHQRRRTWRNGRRTSCSSDTVDWPS